MDLHLGDCLEVLRTFPENSIDSVVTDPPYGLAFMGKKWDYDVPSVDIWKEVFRVLKPGGHLLSFGGTRTYHRMVVNIEDAGFEIRDQIQWLYGSGFPKSHDISKAIDKAAGVERKVLSECGSDGVTRNPRQMIKGGDMALGVKTKAIQRLTLPASDLAKQWQGWGTALKPANEPICLARKPLEKGLTVAENVLKWGTGALNIDGSRIEGQPRNPGFVNPESEIGYHGGSSNKNLIDYKSPLGRWPANLILDEESAQMLDEQSGPIKTKLPFKKVSAHTFGVGDNKVHKGQKFESQKGLGTIVPGASRFFYVAKASKRERGESNNHPTVKPIKLMEYLCKLITPPCGVILDPFMGSGSTGISAKNLSFEFIGIEIDEEYLEIAKKRINI